MAALVAATFAFAVALVLAPGRGGATELSAADLAAFDAACKEASRAAQRKNTGAHTGTDGFYFYGPDLQDLQLPEFWGPAARRVSRAIQPKHADPLPAILDFAEQLKALGIELVVAITPTKPALYHDVLGLKVPSPAPAPGKGKPYRYDASNVRFQELLRANGLTVVDPWSAWMSMRASGEDVFCRQDMHPTGKGYVRLAELLAAELKDRPWLAAAKDAGRGTGPLETAWRDVELTGDLYRVLPPPKPAKEKVALRFVGTRAPDGSLAPVKEDPDSPVLLLGDSNTLVFHAGGELHAVGAGLADQLGYLLGVPLDVIGVLGSGATPARVNLMRRAKKNPGWLAKKKVVVWVFSAREFTETQGWSKVPIGK